MKRLAYTALIALCLSSFIAAAATPSQITFKGKKKTLLGTPYKIYQVRCSDGSSEQISHWENKRPWCTGTRKKQCYTSQLKAASEVCK
jgi:hypothetical protein